MPRRLRLPLRAATAGERCCAQVGARVWQVCESAQSGPFLQSKYLGGTPCAVCSMQTTFRIRQPIYFRFFDFARDGAVRPLDFIIWYTRRWLIRLSKFFVVFITPAGFEAYASSTVFISSYNKGLISRPALLCTCIRPLSLYSTHNRWMCRLVTPASFATVLVSAPFSNCRMMCRMDLFVSFCGTASSNPYSLK